MDVDDFKFVNDTKGHEAGDRALRVVADALRKKASDTEFVARLGGDEFAVILPETDEAGAVAFACDIRALLAEESSRDPIRLSTGIALLTPDNELTADAALVAGDMAQYQAKENGGDRVEVYRGRVSGALTRVDQIRTALAEDRFILYGQPIVDLGTGKVVFKELLLRMLGDDGGIISPGEFLPTAEQFRLIGDIDRWVTEEALRLASAGQRVTMNLAGPSIGNEAILGLVRKAVAGGMDPDNVVVEVTETAAMGNLEAGQVFAGTLHGLGIRLALDDFGTGFGSFTYLKYIHAHYLKIDIEFIRGVRRSATDQQIVKAMVSIARSLGRQTIAEGVEDAATLKLLRDYGVDYAQGFHVGQPERISPETAFEQSLSSSTP
jgi:diguanylate cyclase (GGDEF)-like protein